MKRGRFKLALGGKIAIFILIFATVFFGLWQGVKHGAIKFNKQENVVETNEETFPSEEDSDQSSAKDKTDVEKSDTINISLDEWIGWKPIIDAAGGLTTQPGSIFDKLGVKVNIHVINDATQSSNALIKGELDAAGYTINRVAFLSQKFKDSNVPVIMPYITNYSNGGDGIIATDKFQTVESLVDAKIGVPQFSEAHSLVIWFINQSDLPDSQKQKIIDNLIFFATPDETAKAFFSGQIDVAATWQPYLTQAQNTSNCHVMFSTASSTKLILDGILFREDFAKSNPELVSKFIDGCLQAMDLYDTEFDSIRTVMPMFSGMSDDNIKATAFDAGLADWKSNIESMKEDAPNIFYDMCEVWKSVGESVDSELGEKLFDNTYVGSLSDKYETLVATPSNENPVKVTEENKQSIVEMEALLTKSARVNFIINTAKFTDTAEASKTLDDFIKVAKLLDGTIIQIEGNTDPNPYSDPTDQANIMLSQQRAETVKQYFIMNGIDANRIIAIGNGSSKPITNNDTEENKAMNRRTDVSFKCIE